MYEVFCDPNTLFYEQKVRISFGRDSDRNLRSIILFESFQFYEVSRLVFVSLHCERTKSHSRPSALFLLAIRQERDNEF
jgi:hypothetical protein